MAPEIYRLYGSFNNPYKEKVQYTLAPDNTILCLNQSEKDYYETLKVITGIPYRVLLLNETHIPIRPFISILYTGSIVEDIPTGFENIPTENLSF